LGKKLNNATFLGPNFLPVVVAKPDNRYANRTVLSWSGMTYTEHNGSLGEKKL